MHGGDCRYFDWTWRRRQRPSTGNREKQSSMCIRITIYIYIYNMIYIFFHLTNSFRCLKWHCQSVISAGWFATWNSQQPTDNDGDGVRAVYSSSNSGRSSSIRLNTTVLYTCCVLRVINRVRRARIHIYLCDYRYIYIRTHFPLSFWKVTVCAAHQFHPNGHELYDWS